MTLTQDLTPKLNDGRRGGPGPHKSVGPHMVSQILFFIEKTNKPESRNVVITILFVLFVSTYFTIS